jgi:long-chain acyl-CoA synthetase
MTVNARTLPDLLDWRASATPSAPAYCIKREAGWVPVTWAEFSRGTEAVAKALAAYGVGHGDRVGILGPTCLEWEYLQMGALRIGAVAVGLDANYRDDILQALTRTLDLAALGVKDHGTLRRVPAEVRRGLKVVALFEGPSDAASRSISLPRVVGSEYGSGEEVRAPRAPESDDAAIVVFTSGTTGDPMPITYSHGQVMLAIDEIVNAFPDVGPDSRFACWLPLANLFQRIIDFCALRLGAVSYIVTDPRSLMSELRIIAPTILIGVPRFYERLHAGISSEIGAATGLRGTVARWALRLAERRAANRASAWLADLVVYARVRAAFGSNLRYLVSGSAPMARRLLDWYELLGLPLYEAYGVSQDIVPVAMNRPGARRLGTVGKPLSANDVRLADDGEILVSGPGVYRDFAGVDDEGPGAARYWPTGDLGRFDDEGYLTIIGRKTEVFKSAGGRWIAPQRVEAALRTLSYVDDVLVVGAGRPALVALAHVKWEELSAQDGAQRSGSELSDDVRDLLQRDFADAMTVLPTDEQPKAVILIDQGFSIEGGELTSNLKLRRQVIEARFRSEIENAYRALESASAPHAGAARSRPLVLTGL